MSSNQQNCPRSSPEPDKTGAGRARNRTIKHTAASASLAESELLCDQLCSLAPLLAEIVGSWHPVMRIVKRAIQLPPAFADRAIHARRLARFAIQELPPTAYHALAQAHQQSELAHSRPTHMRESIPWLCVSPMVLIAVDDRALLASLTTVLDSAGFAIQAVANCATAWREANRVSPVLVITDVLLPAGEHFDSIKLTERLIARHIPVLALCSMDVQLIDPLIGFLRRNFAPDELLISVSRLLDSSNERP